MNLTTQDYAVITAVLAIVLTLVRLVEKFGLALLTRYRGGNTEKQEGNPVMGQSGGTNPSIQMPGIDPKACADYRKEVLGEVSAKTGKVHDRLDDVKDSVGEIEKVMIRLEGKVETAIVQQQALIQKGVTDWGQDHIRNYHRKPSGGG